MNSSAILDIFVFGDSEIVGEELEDACVCELNASFDACCFVDGVSEFDIMEVEGVA